MKASVLQFPGSNAIHEMVHTLQNVCGMKVEKVWHTAASLPPQTDLIAIPGGFSYGDYLRCGAIAKASPIAAAIKAHAAKGGYILGVCNGFQILTELGLLPGVLLRNRDRSFLCKDCYVRVVAEGPFTPKIGTVWRLPIAHGEGRYTLSEGQVRRLEQEGCIALRYCTSHGEVTEASNPNGSVDSIAGIYGGATRNILGLMPHPERMSDPQLGGEDGYHLLSCLLGKLHFSASA